MNPTSYVRAIERLWSQLTERAVVLSPREWVLVENWYERGIPLPLIEEVIRERCRRSRPAPRSLSYLASAVEEAWDVIVEGRVAPHDEAAEREPAQPPPADALSQWHRVRDARGTPPAVRQLLDELLEQARRGVGAADLDHRLDGCLAAAVPASMRESVRSEVVARVEAYREQMAPAALYATIERGLVERLRHVLDLPRLVAEPRPRNAAANRRS